MATGLSNVPIKLEGLKDLANKRIFRNRIVQNASIKSRVSA